jgi:hypothetical protein
VTPAGLLPADPPPPRIDDIQPASARTKADFGALLRDVMHRAGCSFNDVIKFAKRHRKDAPQSTSTYSDFVNGRRLPKLQQLRLILCACGVVDDDVLRAWEDALIAVGKREQASRLPALTARDEELNEKLAELQTTINGLNARERALQEAWIGRKRKRQSSRRSCGAYATAPPRD